MIECGRIKLCRGGTQEENEHYIIPIFEGMCQLKEVVYGFTADECGLYMIAPKEVLERQVGGEYIIEDYDFEDYISKTDDIFWVADYLNVKGPSLNRMVK